MNKSFWDEMVKVWCKAAHQEDLSPIRLMASQHAAKDKAHTSGYSVNPLDDDEEEDYL